MILLFGISISIARNRIIYQNIKNEAKVVQKKQKQVKYLNWVRDFINRIMLIVVFWGVISGITFPFWGYLVFVAFGLVLPLIFFIIAIASSFQSITG